MSDTADDRFWIINTVDATFENDVLVRSQLGLVVVDFWADWCGPCRMLGPILDKLANEFGGKFTLVKANSDKCPSAAAQFEVSGIPAVYAVWDGQIIDGFQGLVPEDSIRQWLNDLLRKVALLEIEQTLESSPQKALEKLQQLIESSPDDPTALNLHAELCWRIGHKQQCRAIIERLEQRGFLEPRAQRVKAALDLDSKSNVDLDSVRRAVEAAPGDREKQFALAEALASHRQYSEAFEICLSLVAHDRKRTGEKARQLMVEVFKSLPDDSELTSEYRRKLSLALY